MNESKLIQMLVIRITTVGVDAGNRVVRVGDSGRRSALAECFICKVFDEAPQLYSLCGISSGFSQLNVGLPSSAQPCYRCIRVYIS